MLCGEHCIIKLECEKRVVMEGEGPGGWGGRGCNSGVSGPFWGKLYGGNKTVKKRNYNATAMVIDRTNIEN